jgi:hypothetical protein
MVMCRLSLAAVLLVRAKGSKLTAQDVAELRKQARAR